MRLSTKFKLPILHKYTWMLFINLFLVMYNIGLYNMIKARLKVEEPRGLRAFAENQLKKELMKAKMEKMLEDLQYDQDVGNDVEAAAVQVESLQDDPEFPGEEEGDSIDDKVLDGPDPLESGAEEEVEVIKYAVNTPFNITEIKERAKLKYSESRKQIQAFCRMNMRTDPHLRWELYNRWCKSSLV